MLRYCWGIYCWDILLERETFEIIEQRVMTSCCIWWRLALWRSPPACCWAREGEADDQETAETAHRCPPSQSLSPPSQKLFWRLVEFWRKTALCPLLWLWPDWIGLCEVNFKKVVRSERVQLASYKLKGIVYLENCFYFKSHILIVMRAGYGYGLQGYQTPLNLTGKPELSSEFKFWIVENISAPFSFLWNCWFSRWWSVLCCSKGTKINGPAHHIIWDTQQPGHISTSFNVKLSSGETFYK